MKFDKLSLFSENQEVSVSGTNSATLTFRSKCIDLRLNGQAGIDGMLRIWGAIVGTVNAKGSITTTLQTSADGASWTDVVSEVQDGSSLIAMFLPCKGLKRFIRLKYVSTAPASSAQAATVKVKAGLVDQFDMGEIPLQSFPSPGMSGGALEDLTAAADAIRRAEELGIPLSATSATTAKTTANANVATIYVTNTIGTVAAAVTLSGSTSTHVTATQDGTDPTKWVIACTSSITAADYLVTFTDGFGNTAVFTVTGID